MPAVCSAPHNRWGPHNSSIGWPNYLVDLTHSSILECSFGDDVARIGATIRKDEVLIMLIFVPWINEWYGR